MPMSPRLLRPRQTIHPEAASWASRVVANGGTVSGTTLSAVSTFCESIASAGIRDRFYRMGIFAGSNLNAALVPLYRGPSLGGTQYGGTTDTNVGGLFVSGNYNETGATGGLKGDGSSKWLATGLSPSNLPSLTSLHLSVSGIEMNTSADAVAIGTLSGGSVGGELPGIYDLSSSLSYAGNDRASRLSLSAAGSVPRVSSAGTSEPHIIATRRSATDAAIYRSGTVAATSSTSASPAANTVGWGVFALASGASTASQYVSARLRMYSIGIGISDTDAAAFSAAVANFNNALSRT